MRILSLIDQGSFLIKSIESLERVCKAMPEDYESARWLALAYTDYAFLEAQERSYGEVGMPYRSADTDYAFLEAQERSPRNPLVSLSRALEIFGKLEQRFSVSRRHRLDRAECLVKSAGLELDLGRFAEASVHLGEAHSKLTKLNSEDPDDADVRYWSAVAQRRLGQIALVHERQETQALLLESIAMQERLPEGVPLSIRDLISIAQSHAWLVRANFQAGHEKETSTHLVQIRSILTTIPSKTQVGYVLPTEQLEIDRVSDLIDPIMAADPATTLGLRIEAARKRVNDHRARSKKSPTIPWFRFQAAEETVELAELLRQDGQLAEARTTLQEFFPTLRELSRGMPSNLLWKQSIAQALEILARIEAKSGHPVEALKAADEGVKIMDELAAADSAYLFELACARSVRFEVAQTPTDAAAALETLGKAIADGFANDHRLQTDDRLESLRTRPEFPKMPTDGVRSPRG